MVRSRWSHRNHPTAIAARREALCNRPTFEPEDRRIFPGPDDDTVLSRYQEAYTGSMVLPVGVVGPLQLSLGHYGSVDADGVPEPSGRSEESVYIPLGHTEGGLSASMLRGIGVANAGGGVHTTVLQDMMTRASAFVFDTPEEAIRLRDWTLSQRQAIADWLHNPENPGYHDILPNGRTVISRHAHLLTIVPRVVGPVCHLLYRFYTGEACGPNMITRNAYALNAHIIDRVASIGLSVRHIYLEANLGGDKKPSWEYYQGGHGKTVMATAVVPEEDVRRLLHVDADDLAQLEWTGMHAAHASGMQSFGFTPASAVAALFVVTGQDLGMIGTSSMTQVAVRKVRSGVMFALQFAGLEVGTIGGGTTLPHAQTYLRMMGCSGPGSAQRLAQIVAGAALCLEISAAGSMASRGSENFFRAHFERGGQRGH